MLFSLCTYWYIVGCPPSLLDIIRPPCGPGASYTLAEKETPKITKWQKYSSSKEQQTILECLLWKNQPEKKTTKPTAWSRSRYEYPGTWYVSLEGHLRQPTTNKLEAGPAVKGRDNEGQMRRTFFVGLVATCDVRGTCPTPKLPLFFNLIRWTTKNKSRISETPRPGRYTKTKYNNAFFHTYVPGISYVRTCRNPTPPASLFSF